MSDQARSLTVRVRCTQTWLNMTIRLVPFRRIPHRSKGVTERISHAKPSTRGSYRKQTLRLSLDSPICRAIKSPCSAESWLCFCTGPANRNIPGCSGSRVWFLPYVASPKIHTRRQIHERVRPGLKLSFGRASPPD